MELIQLPKQKQQPGMIIQPGKPINKPTMPINIIQPKPLQSMPSRPTKPLTPRQQMKAGL